MADTGNQPLALTQALKDFHAMPGKFALAAREPRVLFEQLGTVLHLAVGRRPEGFADSDAGLQGAARHFVKAALLRPGADHYTLLGLERQFDPEQLREHYRLLIRLTHPDYVGTETAWAHDVAARVNIAHDTLADAGRRESYDARLTRAPQGMRPDRPPQGHVPPRAAGQRRKAERESATRVTRLLDGRVVTGVALVAVLAAVLLWPATDDHSVQLVARNMAVTTPERAETPAAPAADESSRNPDQALPAQEATPVQVAVPATTAWAPAPSVTANPVATEAPRPRAVPAATPPAPQLAAPSPQPAAPADAPRLGLSYTLSAPPIEPQRPVAAPAPVAPAAPVAASVAPAAPAPVASRPVTAAEMQRLQPVLGELIQLMEGGRSERLQNWVNNRTQKPGAAASVADAYARTLGNARVTGIGKVSFQGQAVADVQVVDGVVELRMSEGDQTPVARDLRLRAHFLVRQGAGPVLSQLDLMQP